MEKMELRVLSSSTEFTSNDDLVVEGLVNETGSWSHVLGNRKKFREQIVKGAFDKAIQEARRIDFLGEHKQEALLATTENGSLQLWEDEEGLKMRAKIAPTSYGKDFYTLMSEKVISHMSFGFKVVKDSWKKGVDGIYERMIESLELLEVSAVRNPAYPQSAIAARGIDLIEDVEIPKELDEEVEERAIDVDALKAELKKELLAELMQSNEETTAKKITNNEEMTSNSNGEEVKTNHNKLQNDNKTIVEKIKNDSKMIQEESKKEDSMTSESNPEVNEPVQTETPKEDEVVSAQEVDDKAKIMDLFHKYKELQGLK